MRAKQIRLSEHSQQRKEWLSAAHLLAEILKGVRQGMANGKAKTTEPERVQENRHLMAHPHAAVLQVAVIKAQPGIEQYLLHSCARGGVYLAREIIPHHRHRIGAKIEIAHF